MKRQVLLGLTAMLICFFIGGFYIIYAIRDATSQLENAVRLHTVDDLNNELVTTIKLLQASLLVVDSPHAKDSAIVQAKLEDLRQLIQPNQHVEQDRQIQDLLAPLREHSTTYIDLVTAVINADHSRQLAPEDKNLAFSIGQQLLNEITAFSFWNDENLSHRSESIYRDITRVSHLITFLVIVGPIAILLLTWHFLRRFTGSIETLVQATQTLGTGDLNYRIDADLRNEFGQLANSFNSMVDDLRRQRDELNSVQQLYQALFNCAGDGIFIIDLSEGREGRIISANPAAAVMHGFPGDELLRMNAADLCVNEACCERMKCALGTWDQYEEEHQRKDGTLFLAEVSMGLLEMHDKKYAILFCRDITQRRREEQQLRQAHHLAAVGEMTAGLAHEIKNPLAGIKVSLEVLADELDLTEEDADLFTRVINETTRVEKLLKELLNYARPPKPHIEHFDLNQLLDNSLKNLFPGGKSADDQNVTISRDYARDLPPVAADSGQLQQVILNILLNGLEAMPEGGELAISTALENAERVRINISDRGKGLTEKQCREIFQPFYTTKTKGTGLGLAICKRIIEQHDGTIEAAQRPGGGATFQLTLPLQRVRANGLSTRLNGQSSG